MKRPSPPGSARPGRPLKKKALAEGRTIVFIDESGLTQKPHRVRSDPVHILGVLIIILLIVGTIIYIATVS
jgi:hypothetical protein